MGTAWKSEASLVQILETDYVTIGIWKCFLSTALRSLERDEELFLLNVDLEEPKVQSLDVRNKFHL